MGEGSRELVAAISRWLTAHSTISGRYRLSRAVMNPLPYRALEVEAKVKSAGAAQGRFAIKVDRHGLYWETLPDGKRGAKSRW